MKLSSTETVTGVIRLRAAQTPADGFAQWLSNQGNLAMPRMKLKKLKKAFDINQGIAQANTLLSDDRAQTILSTKTSP
jgi:hypothetical protein